MFNTNLSKKEGGAIKSYIVQDINKSQLKIGMLVEVLINDDEIKRGRVKEIRTKTVPKNKVIKVELTCGTVGKVIKIITKDDLKTENFKYFNKLFYLKDVYSVYDNNNRTYKTILNKKGSLCVVIFTDKDDCNSFINNKIGNKCSCAKLNMNKNISENFHKIEHIDYIIINNEKIVEFKKFKALEREIKR